MFEKENREYFQSIGLGRADTYYRYDSFSQIVKKLVFPKFQEQVSHFSKNVKIMCYL